MMSIHWLQHDVAVFDENARQQAQARQKILTKPMGALGQLEDIACSLAAMQGNALPRLDNIHIAVFAADHGVAQEGVSAFPQAVTVEMVRNFSRGGAAISVLARELGATLEVINVGTVDDPGALSGVIDRRVAAGTANFCRSPAMTQAQCDEALAIGRDAVQRAQARGCQLFIGGEMGIANTTAATAVACAILDCAPQQLAGPGTGLDSAGVTHKAETIGRALTLHGVDGSDSLEVLRCLGGLEIAALVGAYCACAQDGIPVLVDGFIASVAALVAVRQHAAVAPWLWYAHRSAEPGHAAVLESLAAQPLLDLGMRLGEGSGAAVAVPLLRLALALHNDMATFEEAGVSQAEAQ